ncbi:MAG: hypothetical protein ACXVP4_10860 [Bacteroidia bacterium]
MNLQKNIIYKILVMLLCIAITAASLNQFARLIQHLITIKYDWKFELSMVIGQLIFQFPFIFRKTVKQKTDYYFNMLIVSMIGSVMLLPLITFNYFYLLSDLVNVIYFFAVVMFMFFEHKRRVKKLELPWYISYTWVLYRFLILIFILI